jgi:hypothetical protein
MEGILQEKINNQIKNFTRILFAGGRRGRDHRTRKYKDDHEFALIPAVLLAEKKRKGR